MMDLDGLEPKSLELDRTSFWACFLTCQRSLMQLSTRATRPVAMTMLRGRC